MKNKSSLLLISLLVFAGFAFLGSTPVQADEGSHIVYIGVVEGQNAYNVTEVELEANTEYTIVFVNNDPAAKHNLRIDVNNNLESGGDIADSEDILVGAENDADEGSGASEPTSWNETWTTPESGEILYYCGYAGHYQAGMYGTFIVGGGNAPGFGLIVGLSAILFTALAVPRLRRD